MNLPTFSKFLAVFGVVRSLHNPVTGKIEISANGHPIDISGSRIRHSRPAFIEQHISGFFGRGMLTAEPINVSTECAFTANAAVGDSSLAISNVSNLVAGGCVTVKHDDDIYGSYFVSNISGSSIAIIPSLRHPCTKETARIERTWFNRAHPGKFYMRELAQRVARATELDAAMPNGRRVLFTNVSSNPNTTSDTLVATGSAAINYYQSSNIGNTGTVASPVRFALGRSAYIDNILAVGDGAETKFFSAQYAASVVVKVAILASKNAATYVIKVIDEQGNERGTYTIASGSGVSSIYSFFADIRGAKQIKVRVCCETRTGSGGYFSLHQIDVFDAPDTAGNIITEEFANIVCIGDSWVSGDLGNSIEREPITAQLAIELPKAKIINAGVGGDTITGMLARFDADVVPHAPEYVVVNTGTNECYNPLSVTFDPNAINAFNDSCRKLINKILMIGARPIIIGVPALSQSDADVSGYAEWTLNDRARLYARYVFEKMGITSEPNVVNSNGTAVKMEDGTMICSATISVSTISALTQALATWVFPERFAAAPKVTASLVNYSSAQLVSVGIQGAPSQSQVTIGFVSGSSAYPGLIDCIAIGRWY